MKKNSLIIYIAGIVISLTIIILILFNTIFYNYKGKLHNYLDTYYSQSNNDISNINKIIDRYKNNTNKSNSVSEILESDINHRIEKFNTEYENIDELNNNKDKLIDKFDYFFDNLSSISLIDNKDTVTSKINKLYESKKSYLTAISYINENNYNEAYNNFINVIEDDSYYEITTTKIDEMFNKEIYSLEEEIKSILKFDKNISREDKLDKYKKALQYIANKKKNIAFDISKSKSFNSIKEDIENNLSDIYLSMVEEYENNNKYNQAMELLTESINLLNDNGLDATKLIEKKDELNKMQPISLTSIKSKKEGSSIKEELAISDKNNDAYAKSITFYKNNKSGITYELNKEYKYLTGTLNICKDVSQKKKNYGKIIIYGDNKKIYTSSDFNTQFKKKNIKIKLDDINTLKIEYTISNTRSINKSDILVALLGNPTLEKY